MKELTVDPLEIWQAKDGRWCCWQVNDIKVYATREEAVHALNRSRGSMRASVTTREKRADRNEWLHKRYKQVGVKK